MAELSAEAPVRADRDEDRLEFILAAQGHCDHYLSLLADPAGKSVLVVGAGAGTEMLWCLRHGAREVTGLDVLPQSPVALAVAVARLGLDPASRFAILRLAIEEADSLGRRFDLILSNNVFEHLPALPRAMAVCASLVKPDSGRIAIFTNPLYYSSSGSHLPVEPWEHLWQEPAVLREKLLAADLGEKHPLRELDLPDYLDREISLNRMRLGDFLEAIRGGGLAILNLGLMRDRNLAGLPAYRQRLATAESSADLAVADLTIEGIYVELARLESGASSFESTEEQVLARRREDLERECRRLGEGLEAERRRAGELAGLLAEERRQAEEQRRSAEDHRRAAAQLRQVLDRVEASPSYRIGRTATAPARWLRERFR